jgi:hypothetical protein
MNIRSTRLAVVALTVFLAACNGEVRSRVLTPEQLLAELSRPNGIRGVFGYYDKSVIEEDELTQITDASGKPIGGPCTRITVKRVVSYPDQNHPIQIWYDHGLLEANQFSVQLNQGVFTAINSQSTPDQGKTLSNLASAASTFAKAQVRALTEKPPPTQPYCNAGPSVIGYERLNLP